MSQQNDAHKKERQLLDEVAKKFVPILSRLMKEVEPDDKGNSEWWDLVDATLATRMLSLNDVVEIDMATYQPLGRSLAIRWYKLLANKFGNDGLKPGQLDDLMLPKTMGDQELAKHFDGEGIYQPGTTETHVELIRAAFYYLKLVHCPDRELLPEMAQLLKGRSVSVDCAV